MISKGLRFRVSLTKYKICEGEGQNWYSYKRYDYDKNTENNFEFDF